MIDSIIIDGQTLTPFEENSVIVNNVYVNFTLNLANESFRVSMPEEDFKRFIKHFDKK